MSVLIGKSPAVPSAVVVSISITVVGFEVTPVVMLDVIFVVTFDVIEVDMVDPLVMLPVAKPVSSLRLSIPAARSLLEQPVLHGFDLQQPMKEGFESLHVYHFEPDGQF